jgi:hypothetical protein
MKDNEFEFNANISEIILTKDKAQVVLTIEDTEMLENKDQLSNMVGYSKTVKFTQERD